MKFTGGELAALVVAVSFAAGLNVYATVANLGLLAPVRGPMDRSSSSLGWLVDGWGDQKGQPSALGASILNF
jgi:hypothetical protein